MSRIYFDMNIYNRPFDDQSQVRIRLETIAIFSILQKIKNKELTLLWSFMIDYENSLNPYEDVRQEIEMAASLAVESITPDESVLTAAKEFESKGIKPRDSIHLACALKGKAEYFLTCDDKLIRRATTLDINIKIINPLRFIEDMEVN
ncbi:MAG: type II toxin-antitoxin system VapC family toxin [Nitrospira sp.]|jgi:predicted nucleic acid-binding protein|nr:type II toxin-antitoxin system VapC family toxin [Nitrospira sp.]